MDKGLKSTMISVFVTAGVIYLAVVVFMYAYQRSLLYYPNSPKPTRAESGVAEMEELGFTTEDGLELFAWYAPPQDPAKPTVVIFHGNAGTLGDRGHKARLLLDAGYGAMLVEYRAYAGNPGTPTEQGLYADARAALARLRDRAGGDVLVVLYGESLGTGVATAMALEAQQNAKPVAALILEAPFTSTVDVGAGHYPFLPVRVLMKDRYESLARIRDIHTSLLIVHGERDRVVPAKFGKRLFAAANPPKEHMWIADAGHNDLYDFGMGERVLEFLASHTGQSAERH
ncbi:alpha/beta hydrolase [Magnetovibrio sp.]|uniref:alpha/beta hydrolase n=1 Tax=Magnetovibrio sp. TaxID=2024836 RepID=UPI002F94669F